MASPSPSSLLLLPALGLTSIDFRSSYKSTFEALLPKLVPEDKDDQKPLPRLDIALVLSPSYPLPTNTARALLFASIQNLLKQTYSLVCAVAAEKKVDLDFPGGLDVRVFILERRVDELPNKLVGKQILSGPIVDVDTFVLSDRSYGTIYSVEGESGEGHLKQFLTTWGSKHRDEPPPVVRLPSGPAIIPTSTLPPHYPSSTEVEDGPATIHRSVAVGGTFDHLHIGHKLLLTGTILAADPDMNESRLITVGMTGDEMLVNKKYGTQVESWTTRQERTAEFVDSILAFYPRKSSPNSGATGLRTTEYIDKPGPNGKVVRVTYHLQPSSGAASSSSGGDVVINYTQISDPFGPTIVDPDISALVISAETRAGGKAVNDKRTEKGWAELEVFEIDVLDASAGLEDDEPSGARQQANFESKISSTEIRKRLQERK